MPRNANENQELANIFKAEASARNFAYHKKIPHAGLWLRVDDSAKEGAYVDSKTKDKVNYFNWYPGMPNNWKWSAHPSYSPVHVTFSVENLKSRKLNCTPETYANQPKFLLSLNNSTVK